MNKFCANCGSELNGKSKCDKCGKVSAETAVNNLVDKVKNYDYKGKAKKVKDKAADIADKAKSYDYKAKAEEVKETVTNYDYKGKAKEVTEAVKNFDYEEKAKEISDTIKNYDYKGEAENIKKGGFKYFWSKHKKLSVAVIAIFAISCIVVFNSNNADTKHNDISTNTKTNSKAVSKDDKFIRDDDFILDYASKSDYRFKYKIVERDKYNRYLLTGEALKDYEKYMTEQVAVIIYQINADYTVREFKETNPNKKQLKSMIKTMKSYDNIWDEEPFMTEIAY